MKEIALHKLEWKHNSAVARTEQQVGDRVADVYLRFEEPDHRYGYGLIAEVQYKNDSKDIEAVTEEYLNHGYSVYWLDESNFNGHDVFLSHARLETVWPQQVPEQKHWSGMSGGYEWDVINDSIINGSSEFARHIAAHSLQLDAADFHGPDGPAVPARFPADWYRDHMTVCKSHWRGLCKSDSTTPAIGEFWDFSEVEASFPPNWFKGNEQLRRAHHIARLDNDNSIPDGSIPLSENNASRSCVQCSESADFYVQSVGFLCRRCINAENRHTAAGEAT